MDARPDDALVTLAPDGARAELAVNFGLASGRTATAAEIQDLGGRLLESFPFVEIRAEDVYELGRDAAATVHRVRVRLRDAGGLDDAAETARSWLAECVGRRAVSPLDGTAP
jgi:hypothetical protein